MDKVLITVRQKASNNAGPKATNDVAFFLNNYRGIKLEDWYFDLDSKFNKLIYKQFMIPQKLSKFKNQQIFLQYPIYSKPLLAKTIDLIKKNQNQLILIVHDIEMLRDSSVMSEEELAFLKRADGVIVHTEKMKQWLLEKGINSQIEILGIFDYASDCLINKDHDNDRGVCFAGNLAKAEFLNKYNEPTHFNVYGPNPQLENYSKEINYQGSYQPDILPEKLVGSYGLVWDGDAIDKCNGMYGEYLKYNCPHKLSLYLSSGIPAIIWSQSAMASFVREHQVGLVLDSLTEIESVLNQVTTDEYKAIKDNAIKLAKQLRSGSYIKAAVDKFLS